LIRFVLSFLGAIFAFATLGGITVAMGIAAVFIAYGRDLPNHGQLARYAPATISRIYSGEGRIIDEFAHERRLFAAVNDIPYLVKQAFISAEDKNFHVHRGFDARGIAVAAYEAVRSRGATLRGASTITQQVTKNFLLGGERRVERKIKEIILATRIEETLTKDRILELYLNEIYLGANSYGVAAAARVYFNKPLAELTAGEAAYLAALPKKPAELHPVRDYDDAVDRRNYVLSEMHENGYLTRREYRFAQSEPLRSVQNGDYPSFGTTLPPRDYFTDEIRRQLSRDFGEADFFTAGYSVRATVDRDLQPAAALSLQRALEDYDRARGVWRGTGLSLPAEVLEREVDWRAALAEVEISRDIGLDGGWIPAVVLQVGRTHARIGIEDIEDDEDGHWIAPEDVQWARPLRKDGSTGSKAARAGDLLSVGDVVHVRAIASEEDGAFVRWSLRQVPEVQGGFVAMDVHTGRVLAMQGGFSYRHSVFNRTTQADRQPGSAFKPFVYAAALDSGFTPATIVVDAPIEVDTGVDIWRPRNATDKFYGPTPLRTGIERSRNLMTVRVAREIGMETIAGYAERFGVYDRMNPFLANALGAQETTLYKMVAAYAMFANGGRRIEPSLVDRVQNRWGETIYRHDRRDCQECGTDRIPEGRGPLILSDRERVLNAVTAYQLTSMMQGVVERGTAAGRVTLEVPAAGKTGTTNDARDVWFIGFTSNIVAGCYIGFDRPRPLGRDVYGGNTCGPVFDRFMRAAAAKYGGGPFEAPEGGRFINIDRYSGARLPEDAIGEHVVAEYFLDGKEPVFGVAGMIDGGFAMGSNLPLLTPDEIGTDQGGDRTVTTSTGETARVGERASTESLSSGGLY